jgi:hypothetical protein
MRIHLAVALLWLNAIAAMTTTWNSNTLGARIDTVNLLPETTPEEVTDVIAVIATGQQLYQHGYEIIVAGILQNRQDAQHASSADKTRLDNELMRWMDGLGTPKEIVNVVNVLVQCSSRTNPASLEALEKLYEGYVARFESIDDAMGAAVHHTLDAVYRHVTDSLMSETDHRPDYFIAFKAFVKKCQKQGKLAVLERELARLSPFVAARVYDTMKPEVRSSFLFRCAQL